MKYLFTILLVIIFPVSAISQVFTPNKVVNLGPNPETASSDKVRGADSLPMNLSNSQSSSDPIMEAMLRKKREKESAKRTSKETLKEIGLYAADADKYGDFLKKNRLKALMLAPNGNCDENAKSIDVKDPCIKYPVPGLGGAYSFRIGEYREKFLSDLVFTGENFAVAGYMTQGIITKLGQIPLTEADLKKKDLDFIQNLNPKMKSDEAKNLYDKLLIGIEVKGRTYTNRIKVEEGNTYVLRSIAYNAPISPETGQKTFYQFHFDPREDIIIAFQVFKKYSDGNILVFWKEWKRKAAPNLK